MYLARFINTVRMTLVTRTYGIGYCYGNRILEAVLYKAMIMYTFLGTAKMIYSKQSRSKYSAHSVQWGINKRFWEKKKLSYSTDDTSKKVIWVPRFD